MSWNNKEEIETYNSSDCILLDFDTKWFCGLKLMLHGNIVHPSSGLIELDQKRC